MHTQPNLQNDAKNTAPIEHNRTTTNPTSTEVALKLIKKGNDVITTATPDYCSGYFYATLALSKDPHVEAAKVLHSFCATKLLEKMEKIKQFAKGNKKQFETILLSLHKDKKLQTLNDKLTGITLKAFFETYNLYLHAPISTPKNNNVIQEATKLFNLIYSKLEAETRTHPSKTQIETLDAKQVSAVSPTNIVSVTSATATADPLTNPADEKHSTALANTATPKNKTQRELEEEALLLTNYIADEPLHFGHYQACARLRMEAYQLGFNIDSYLVPVSCKNEIHAAHENIRKSLNSNQQPFDMNDPEYCNDADAIFNVIQHLAIGNNSEDAFSFYNVSSSKNLENDAFFTTLLGHIYQQNQKYAEAAAYYKKSIQFTHDSITPDHLPAYFNYVQALRSARPTEIPHEVIITYSKLYVACSYLPPEKIDGSIALSYIKESLNEFRNNFVPSSEAMAKQYHLLSMATAISSIDQESALLHFSIAILCDKDNPHVFLSRAIAFINTGRYLEAHHDLQHLRKNFINLKTDLILEIAKAEDAMKNAHTKTITTADEKALSKENSNEQEPNIPLGPKQATRRIQRAVTSAPAPAAPAAPAPTESLPTASDENTIPVKKVVSSENPIPSSITNSDLTPKSTGFEAKPYQPSPTSHPVPGTRGRRRKPKFKEKPPENTTSKTSDSVTSSSVTSSSVTSSSVTLSSVTPSSVTSSSVTSSSVTSSSVTSSSVTPSSVTSSSVTSSSVTSSSVTPSSVTSSSVTPSSVTSSSVTPSSVTPSSVAGKKRLEPSNSNNKTKAVKIEVVKFRPPTETTNANTTPAAPAAPVVELSHVKTQPVSESKNLSTSAVTELTQLPKVSQSLPLTTSSSELPKVVELNQIPKASIPQSTLPSPVITELAQQPKTRETLQQPAIASVTVSASDTKKQISVAQAKPKSILREILNLFAQATPAVSTQTLTQKQPSTPIATSNLDSKHIAQSKQTEIPPYPRERILKLIQQLHLLLPRHLDETLKALSHDNSKKVFVKGSFVRDQVLSKLRGTSHKTREIRDYDTITTHLYQSAIDATQPLLVQPKKRKLTTSPYAFANDLQYIKITTYNNQKGRKAPAIDIITNCENPIGNYFKHCDFTVNTLMYDPFRKQAIIPTDEIILSDLHHRIVRVVPIKIGEKDGKDILEYNPKKQLEADPIKMLRAIDLCTSIDGKIEPNTEKAIRDCGHLLRLPALEGNNRKQHFSKMNIQLKKLFFNGNAVANFDLMKKLGLTAHLFPNLRPKDEALILAILSDIDVLLENKVHRDLIPSFQYFYAMLMVCSTLPASSMHAHPVNEDSLVTKCWNHSLATNSLFKAELTYRGSQDKYIDAIKKAIKVREEHYQDEMRLSVLASPTSSIASRHSTSSNSSGFSLPQSSPLSAPVSLEMRALSTAAATPSPYSGYRLPSASLTPRDRSRATPSSNAITPYDG